MTVEVSNNTHYLTPEEWIDPDDGEECIIYKAHEGDQAWQIHYPNSVGKLAVTFDKKKILNLWRDYPENFTSEEKEIFDRENPYWANFFKGRCK